MSWDQILTGFIYLAVVLVLVGIGRWGYDALHRGFVLRTELLEKDNLAMALTIAGYYLGLAIVLGGVVSGPGSGVLTEDVIESLRAPLAGEHLIGHAVIRVAVYLGGGSQPRPGRACGTCQ